MGIYLSTLEHGNVPIELREILSFTRSVVSMLTQKLAELPQVEGCALLSTCNRTELYISAQAEQNPGRLLCRVAQVDYGPFEEAFRYYSDKGAVDHLIEVASGLRSRIVGEDQIISQVKDAIRIARDVKAADPVLETLFRTAVTAGKELKSRVRLTAVPASAASRAVDMLEERLGGLQGKRAMVIGNGEMGRLSASLLRGRGCDVLVTLRTYRHGVTIVPPGCRAVPYEDRFSHMEGLDCLISATAGPHFTVRAEDFSAVCAPPRWLVDLAIPRDIQPEIGEISGVKVLNVDDLADGAVRLKLPPVVDEILQKHKGNFYRWLNYRDCMPVAETLKKSILDRLLTARELEYSLDAPELLRLAVDRTVNLLAAGLSEQIHREDLNRCSKKIQAHTTAKPVLQAASTGKPGSSRIL